MNTEPPAGVRPPSGSADAWRVRVERLAEEFRSVAAGVLRHAEALAAQADRLGSHDARADADRIVAAALHLDALIADLLTDASGAGAEHDAEREARWRHDLRTPVNAIEGYAEIVLEDHEGDAGAALRAEAEEIVRECARVLDLVHRLQGAGPRPTRRAAPASVAAFVRTTRADGVRATPLHDRAAILVVDDNEANRDYLARRLAREGHAVTHAASGESALDLLAVNDFDLVLLDLVMPEMSGFEVLTRLKASEHSRHIPVVMVSGVDAIADVARCIEAGAEDYLTKPFDPVLLKARIAAGLERKCWREREREFLHQVEAEQHRTEELLLNILPRGVVDRLAAGEQLIADRFDAVTVLFSDIVGFTRLAADTSAARLVEILNRLFSEFDALAGELGVEKIKTVGDAYMAAAGLPERRADHARAAATMALGMLDGLARVNAELGIDLKMRLGLHSGPVIAGIIGTDKFAYDLWGTTVNFASRMESYGEPGRIHVSADCAALLGGDFELASRGVHPIRGMGEVETFFVVGSRQAPGALVGE